MTTEYLKAQVDALGKIFETCYSDNETAQALNRAAHLVATIEKLISPLIERFEYEVLVQAAKELQFSILAVAVGNYRQGFSSLRLFFELFLAGIEFSSNERLYRGWKNGKENIVWARITDRENGLFTKNFCDLFFPALRENASQYRTMAEAVYSECSQFVHGNPTTNEALPATLSFSKHLVIRWADKLDTMMLVSCMAYATRHLLYFSEIQRDLVSGELLDQLGTIEEVRVVLGGPGG